VAKEIGRYSDEEIEAVLFMNVPIENYFIESDSYFYFIFNDVFDRWECMGTMGEDTFYSACVKYLRAKSVPVFSDLKQSQEYIETWIESKKEA